MINKAGKGKNGEKTARAFLEKKGLKFIEANFRAMRCEVDLIMRDRETVVFIEVKARSSSLYGFGREAVTLAKQRNIIKAATAYAAMHGLMDKSLRFDVVEVDLTTGHAEHIKNAFHC